MKRRLKLRRQFVEKISGWGQAAENAHGKFWRFLEGMGVAILRRPQFRGDHNFEAVIILRRPEF